MSGETELNILLKNMSPRLVPGDYVFCTIPDQGLLPASLWIGAFREREGVTFILEREQADTRRLAYDGLLAWITLDVHSSLQAVGLTAAVSAALAEAGISCNIVAAYYHDHLFVPKADAARALSMLQNLSSRK